MRLFRRTATVDAAGAADLLDTRRAVLVDVRQAAEWKAWARTGLPLVKPNTRKR